MGQLSLRTDIPQTYRKKPVEIEALRWQKEHVSLSKLREFTNHLVRYEGEDPDTCKWFVYDRLHDTWVEFAEGDYLIKGLQGEFYPCKADVFVDSYELVPKITSNQFPNHPIGAR